MVMAPETADRFNGQQGDYWDAQKDMALALAGALVAIMVIAIRDELARPHHDARPISFRYARGRRAIS